MAAISNLRAVCVLQKLQKCEFSSTRKGFLLKFFCRQKSFYAIKTAEIQK